MEAHPCITDKPLSAGGPVDDPRDGIVAWEEEFHGFTLFVIHDTQANTLWPRQNPPGQGWNPVRLEVSCDSLAEAQSRCYGMTSLYLESWMHDADEKQLELEGMAKVLSLASAA